MTKSRSSEKTPLRQSTGWGWEVERRTFLQYVLYGIRWILMDIHSMFYYNYNV